MLTNKTPFLWPGSKDKTYKRIKDYIPEFKTYCEPFAGGGAIYFRLLASRGIFPAKLSDINNDLITAYKVMRDDPDSLCDGLPLEKNRDIWNKLSKSNPTNKCEQAIRFLYLNRNSFFGLGGWMNADRYCRDQIINRIKFFSPLMQETEFSDQGCFHFDVDDSDYFVFVDPPYPDTANESCYKIKPDNIMKLNLDFLKYLCETKANFFWIVNHHQKIIDEFKKYNDVKIEEKEWIFRKPGKLPQKSIEIYARRKVVPIDTLFY